MTNPSVQDRFDAIAEDTLTAAETIAGEHDCSLTEFIDGLKSIMQAVGDRLRAAVDEKDAYDRHAASSEQEDA